MFPITLSPYRSNFVDVIKAISSKGITSLNRGIEVDMPNSQKVILVAFTLAFLSNMP